MVSCSSRSTCGCCVRCDCVALAWGMCMTSEQMLAGLRLLSSHCCLYCVSCGEQSVGFHFVAGQDKRQTQR